MQPFKKRPALPIKVLINILLCRIFHLSTMSKNYQSDVGDNPGGIVAPEGRATVNAGARTMRQ
jgi:hypothetical protein